MLFAWHLSGGLLCSRILEKPNNSSFIHITFPLMAEGFQNANINKCKITVTVKITCAQRVVVGEEGKEQLCAGCRWVMIAPSCISGMNLQIGILIKYSKNETAFVSPKSKYLWMVGKGKVKCTF